MEYKFDSFIIYNIFYFIFHEYFLFKKLIKIIIIKNIIMSEIKNKDNMSFDDLNLKDKLLR